MACPPQVTLTTGSNTPLGVLSARFAPGHTYALSVQGYHRILPHLRLITDGECMPCRHRIGARCIPENRIYSPNWLFCAQALAHWLRLKRRRCDSFQYKSAQENVHRPRATHLQLVLIVCTTTTSFDMSVSAEFEAANEKYAASFDKGDLPLPPRRYASLRIATITRSSLL